MSNKQNSRPKTRNRLINLTVTFVSTVICVLLLEITLRWIAPHKLYSSLVPSVSVEKEQDVAGFYPGIDSVIQFSVNEFGYRSQDYFNQNRFGILAIGGSTTYCIGLSDNETWPWRLEGLLNESGFSQQFAVGNVGVPAFNAGSHWHQLNQLEPQFENIEMVLMLVGVNDFARVLFLGDRYFPTSEDTHLYNRTFVRLPRKGKPKWYQRTELFMHLRDAYHAYQSTKSQRYTPERLDNLLADYLAARKTDSLPSEYMAEALLDYERNLRNIAKLAHERKLHLVWITQPTLWYEGMGEFEENISSMGAPVVNGVAYSPKVLAQGMDAFNHKLREVAQSEQIDVIDLARILPKDTTIFYDWCHYNKSGSIKVAEAIYRELEVLISGNLTSEMPGGQDQTHLKNRTDDKP